MKKIIVALVLVAVLAAAYAYLSWPAGVTPSIDEGLARQIVKNVTNETDFNVTHYPSCEENGGRPCWRAETANGSLSIDSETGSPAGAGIGAVAVIPCRVSYTEGGVHYYNTGCENPLPKCDDATETCRACSSASDCIRKRELTYISGVEEQVITWYGFEGIGSGLEGSYNNFNHVCRVEINNVLAFEGDSSHDGCMEKCASFMECSSGACSGI